MNSSHKILKRLEMFCGTGGVGKTTLAASRAIFYAKQKKKVLLITIDPSRRLKDFFAITDERAGTLEHVEVEDCKLDVLLMNPQETIRRFTNIDEVDETKGRRVLDILFRPYGGMNELMALMELYYRYQENIYDYIVLDTPPGPHFVDFLASTHKYKLFFHKSFVEIFDFIIGNKSFIFENLQEDSDKKVKEKGGLFAKIVASGIKKILFYFKKVTGESFLLEFIEALHFIYQFKDPFLAASRFQQDILQGDQGGLFLVTSVEQDKFSDALVLFKNSRQYLPQDFTLLVNKVFFSLEEERPTSDVKEIQQFYKLIEGREKKVLFLAKENFSSLKYFPEILTESPSEQLMNLLPSWD